MKLLAWVLVVVGLLHARAASASSPCVQQGGMAPHAAVVLPPRPQLVAFDTRYLHGAKLVARIGGKRVPITTEEIKAEPFELVRIQIESSAVGTLKIYRLMTDSSSRSKRAKEHLIGKYRIDAKAKLPEALTATTRRMTVAFRHTTSREQYDALVLDLGEAAPATLATVRLRRDDKAPWQTLAVPVLPGDLFDPHSVARLGELGCGANFSVAALEQGVELEAEVALVDGTTRPLAVPRRLVLPPPTPEHDR